MFSSFVYGYVFLFQTSLVKTLLLRFRCYLIENFQLENSTEIRVVRIRFQTPCFLIQVGFYGS